MTDKTHQMIGLSAATGVFLTQYPDLQVTWPVAGTILIGSFVGSITPDIDQPTSGVWDAIPLGGIVGKVASRALGGHRNLSHSLLGFLLFFLLIRWLAFALPEHWFLEPQILLQSALAGFLAHLAADAVTVLGIPLFWPLGGNLGFPPYPFQGIRILTGKWFENLIVLPLAIVLLLILIATHTERFCPIVFGFCQ